MITATLTLTAFAAGWLCCYWWRGRRERRAARANLDVRRVVLGMDEQ